MKKMLALLLALVMVLSLAACASSQPAAASTETAETTETTEPAAEESAEAPAESGKTYTVGVCQLVQHEALDAATQGFIDALKEELGDAVTVDVQNASGDSVNCGTIVNGFVSKGVDLIMANATPALTAAVSATADIPILGTSITAYGVALDIDDFNGTVGGNVSGTSDLADLQARLETHRKDRDLLEKQLGAAKKVAGDEAMIVYMDPSDEDKARRLAMHHNVTVKISEYSFDGGIRAVIPSKHILIDSSFKTKLEEARHEFKFDLGGKQ